MIALILEVMGRVLSFDPDVGSWVLAHERPFAIATGVALISAASLLLGQSIILVLNRIRGWRFVASLALGAALIAGFLATMSLAIWGIGRIFGANVLIREVFIGMMLSASPLVLGVLGMLPFLGVAISRLLFGWAGLLILLTVRGLFDIGIFRAIGAVALAWLALEVLARTLGRPLTMAVEWLVKAVSGRQVLIRVQDLASGKPLMVEDLVR